jgi:uncharacterized membrane protein HdeD (DUF308 family)
MVAPDDDFPVRQKHRAGRRRAVFAMAALPARELLDERRLSVALRSMVALFFGIGFLWPGVPDAVVIRLFALYAFADGVLVLAPGGWAAPYRLGWPLLIGGCIDIGAACAVYLWLWFGMTMSALANIALPWAVGHAIAFTVACITLRRSDTDHLFLASGIASLVFARALLSPLTADPIILSTWIGLYAVTMAVLFLKLTLKHYQITLL